MGFEEQSFVETFKKSEVVRIEFLTLKTLNYRSDFCIMSAHRLTLESESENPKLNVLARTVSIAGDLCGPLDPRGSKRLVFRHLKMKRTPLYSAHQKLGAKLIEFGGWEMPVQYTSSTDEHLAVRKAAGIFDISHMGEVSVTGSDADNFLNETLTNDLRKVTPGQGQYTLMCNVRGGVIDDLYAYRIGVSDFLLIINASRIEPDVAWLQNRLAGFP